MEKFFHSREQRLEHLQTKEQYTEPLLPEPMGI